MPMTANALREDMQQRLKASSIGQLARQQVDGIVRRHECGRDDFIESIIPSAHKCTIRALQGGCCSVLIERNSYKLISGGHGQTVKVWDALSGSPSRTFHGCLGSILDVAVTHDNRYVIAGTSKNSLLVWDLETGQSKHTLTDHQDKVCAVDANRFSRRHLMSAGYDHTIRVWDLQKGYCINTIFSGSNCNALCYSVDGSFICSGHVDGSLRLWDSQAGKVLSEVAAHSQAVTSVRPSHSGNIVLASGRDNLHNLFDMRSLEVRGTLRATGCRVASKWSRSCLSLDDSYVAAGTADGSVYVCVNVEVGCFINIKGRSFSSRTCIFLGWPWKSLGICR